MSSPSVEVVTVTPNPAIDWTVTVPGFVVGAVNRAVGQRSNPAGKGVNVASALADHGVSVAVTGFLGRGNATPFEVLFARKRIHDHFVRIDGETRVAIKVVDPASQETTDLNFPGPAPGPTEVVTLMERVAALAAGESRACFVLAGSLPPGVAATLYRDLVLALKSRGCRVVLDTSGDALRYALDAAPHVVKPNVHELEAMLGESLPTREAVVRVARAFLARGVELAVVSMGEEGALFVERGAVVLALPPAVPIQSTVGAGDAMVAGVVSGRLRGLPLPEVARLATAFSLDALTRDDPHSASPAAAEAWMREVTVREIG